MAPLRARLCPDVVAAAATSLGAYLIGDVINQAYVHKNLTGIIVLALVTAAIFMIKGFATYGQALTMARIGNRSLRTISAGCSRACCNRTSAFFPSATARNSSRGSTPVDGRDTRC